MDPPPPVSIPTIRPGTPSLRAATLGCKVNQYETELVREGLLQSGYREALADEPAQLCIVNTCTVTHEGDAKSRQLIRRLARQNPGAPIVVMGCYATREPDQVARLPQVVEVVTDKRELPDVMGRFGVIDFPSGLSGFGHRHRAYVKVQDGCLLRCSYCIIPQVRPHMESRPAAHILEEIQRLVDRGYREIVLTGIHLGHYGVDHNRGKPREQWTRLADLVRRIARLSGEFRVRLSSIEATEVTRSLLEVIAENPHKVSPHLHICLQSGSDAVLRHMNRRWGTRRFLDRCHLAQSLLDQPALTTDVIVGFPGETDEDFARTCDLVQAVGFSKLHIFPFSARRGTPAATMSPVVPSAVITERCRALAELERTMRDRYYGQLVGKHLRVLIEGIVDDGAGKGRATVRGTACRYAPVEFKTIGRKPGELVDVVGTSTTDGLLHAVDRSDANSPTVVSHDSVGCNRRQILATSGMLAAGWLLDRVSVGQAAEPKSATQEPLFKISLTEYSLHRMLAEKKLDPLDFPRFTRETFGLDAVEYWNIPFKSKVDDHEYLREMRRRADAAKITGLLILIDGEGELGNPDDQARLEAVERHQKWVTAAHLLGCHSIRVNARSQGDTTKQLQLMTAGLRPLCKFAASMGIHVLVENHGDLSSDAEWVSQLIKAVGLPNAGTLPDFANFDGRDRYQGVQTLMPFAKSVCAKSMDFDDQGNEVGTDYERMLKIVVKAGYRGYVGIEYEGSRLTEVEGVHATLRLLQRVRDRMTHEADS